MRRTFARAVSTGLLVLILSGCGFRNPFEPKSTATRWLEATLSGNYAAAGQVIVAQDASAWRMEAERLAAQHGKITVIQSDDVVPNQGQPYRSVRVTWADGYQRCLRFDLPIGDRIDILDSGWQDCSGVQFNPTPGP